MCIAQQIQIDEALVDLLLACDHIPGIGHVVLVLAAKLGVGARHITIIRVPDNHLAHLVDKVGLAA